MTEAAFFTQIQQSLQNAVDLEQIEIMLHQQAEQVALQGRELVFVVGKISPTQTCETFEENKAALKARTQQITELLPPEQFAVFSSAVVPDSLEGKFDPSRFYALFEGFIRPLA